LIKKTVRPLLLMVFSYFVQSAHAIEIGSYFPSWSADNNFHLKQLEQSGLADKFTYLNYAFENIYQVPDGTFRCSNGSDIDDHSAGQGMRVTLDYLHHFNADESVDGSADHEGQLLAGNFNQIRQIKARHPQLKVLVSLGGWTWSRWFSAASATPALRRTLVASCINLYIKGNLPVVQDHGGAGAAAGVFDGFDIDWEHPGLQGFGYNTVSKNDKKNYTLLLAEFRKQFNALSKKNGKHYFLSVAINTAPKNVQQTEPNEYAKSLDWINLMTYDFHGGWDKNGPTNFQSNLYADPGNPDHDAQSIDGDVQGLLKAGVPPEKLVIGIPFYARGWSGVDAENHGLYQKAIGPTQGFDEGATSYTNMASKSVTKYYHPVTKQLWTYDQGAFWTYDDPVVIREKINYIRQYKLGGIMSWSIDQDDAEFTLSRTMVELRTYSNLN
jgi:chitinase